MTDHRAGAGSGATPDQVFKTFEWMEVARRARLGRTYSGLAAVLAGYADKDGTSVFPGVAGLANDAEVSYNVAKAFLKFMQEVGLVRFVRRRYHRGVRISDEYQLTLDWARIKAASKKDDVAFLLPDPSQRRAAVEALDQRKRGKHKPAGGDVDASDEAVDGAPAESPSPVDDADLAAHGTGRSISEVAAHRTGRRVEVAAHGTTHLAAHPIGANQAMDHPMVKRTTPPTTSLSSQRSRPRSSTADRPAGRPSSTRRPRPPRPSSGPARRPARRRSPRITGWIRSALRRASTRHHRAPVPPVNRVHT